MCYPCTQCGRCGKYEEDSPYYVPPARIPCLACGGEVSPETGLCGQCGERGFPPAGKGHSSGELGCEGWFGGRMRHT